DNSPVNLTGGETKGLIDLRDKIIPDQMAQLNNMARTIVSAVNAQHRQGFTLNGTNNVDFFQSGPLGTVVNSAVFNAAGNPITVGSVDVSHAQPDTYTLASSGPTGLTMTRASDGAGSNVYT